MFVQPTRLLTPGLLVLICAALLLAGTTASFRDGGPLVEGLRPSLSNLSLPLSFEANQGQADPQARYLVRAGSYTLYLADEGPVMILAQGDETTTVSLEFVGANPTPAVAPADPLPATVNYFIGNDPAKWRTGIPTYGAVQYHSLYPGIDAVFYGAQGQLEYDFIVSPGASPDTIALEFSGADSLSLDDVGNLLVQTSAGTLEQARPFVYQEIAGVRRAIEGSYVIHPDSTVGFEIGAHDESQPLVIDPILIFGSYLGGGLNDVGYGVATDDGGNVYVTGRTRSLDFPTTAGVLSEGIAGDVNQQDVFVTKIGADGTEILYSTYLGGTGGNDIGFDIEVDDEGQAFIAGRASGDDFPLTPGAFNTDAGTTGFVAKLSDDGSELLYSTRLGVNTDAYGLEIDGNGNALFGGWDLQNNFDVPGNAYQTQGNGSGDAIVGILNEDGTGLIAGTYIGGSMREQGFDVAWDDDGYVYLTGQTPSEDFPTENAFQNTKADQPDAFAVKFMPDLSDVMYSTYLGGDGGGQSDQGYGIDADSDGNAYVTGFTNSPDFPTSGNAFQAVLGGGSDAFVTKFGPTGNLVYSTYLGGSNQDHGAGIALDGDGNAHVAGFTVSNNFPTEDAVQSSLGGSADAFAAKLNADGSALIYSTYLGGSATDRAGNSGTNDAGGIISIDDLGNAYVVGETSSNNFPTMEPFQPTNAGESDVFVVKLVGEGLLWGDVDCGGAVNSVDALKILRHVASLPVAQPPDCPDIGDQVQIQPAGAQALTWGDIDCQTAVNSVDALKELRYVAGLSVAQGGGCPGMGSIIQLQ